MVDYDPHHWSTFFDLRGTMLMVLSRRAGVILLTATAATLAHYFWRPLGIAAEAHILIGPSLSLLLVFRTNSSYDRFWEGRKLWGTLVNTSRNLARLATVHLHKDPVLCARVLRLTVAFVYASMHQLRGTRGIGPVETELDPELVGELTRAVHTPTRVATVLSATVQRAHEDGVISDIQQRAFEQNVQLLVDCIGACERIHGTPLPFAYVVHLRRALVIFCASLPFALLPRFGWGTIAAATLIAVILFGIEEIGVEIEDPFGTDDNDLPLEEICANIERNVRAFLPGATS